MLEKETEGVKNPDADIKFKLSDLSHISSPLAQVPASPHAILFRLQTYSKLNYFLNYSLDIILRGSDEGLKMFLIFLLLSGQC